MSTATQTTITKFDRLTKAMAWIAEHGEEGIEYTFVSRMKTTIAFDTLDEMRSRFAGQTATVAYDHYSTTYSLQRDGIDFRCTVYESQRVPENSEVVL
jgi:hypothetical protein